MDLPICSQPLLKTLFLLQAFSLTEQTPHPELEIIEQILIVINTNSIGFKIKSFLYLRHHTEACNKGRCPSPQLSATPKVATPLKVAQRGQISHNTCYFRSTHRRKAGFGLKSCEMSMFLPSLINHLTVQSMVFELFAKKSYFADFLLSRNYI